LTTLADRSRLAGLLAVYLVADPEQARPGALPGIVAAAVANGVTMVQLRAKTLSNAAFRAEALDLMPILAAANVPFIVNDRFRIAVELGAAGVHLGEHDLPVAEARKLAPAGFIIGASPKDIAQAAAAREDGAEYVGVGPVYATGSKNDAGAAIGLAGLAAQIEAAKLPAVGIGGITAENASEVILAGADGVAVISAIQRAPDPGLAAAALAAAVNGALTRA
jgi:thiamine-phosphate pyrophosphorylase